MKDALFKIYLLSKRDSLIKRISFLIWLKLIRSPKEAERAYYFTKRGTRAELVSLKKWFSLVSSIDEAKQVINHII